MSPDRAVVLRYARKRLGRDGTSRGFRARRNTARLPADHAAEVGTTRQMGEARRLGGGPTRIGSIKELRLGGAPARQPRRRECQRGARLSRRWYHRYDVGRRQRDYL